MRNQHGIQVRHRNARFRQTLAAGLTSIHQHPRLATLQKTRGTKPPTHRRAGSRAEEKQRIHKLCISPAAAPEQAYRDIYLSQVTASGKLPSWNAIVHDFHDHDAVWRLEIIPSAAITTGEFRNIPYLSFVVNKQAKLNILGNPADPVGIQFAIFGKKGRNAKYHQIVRQFLAGHLHTREEIAALYSLSPRGDQKQTGRLAFLITPHESPDAHGAWALTIYDPSRLAAARVPDGEYAAMTRPFGEIHRRDGTITPAGAQRLDQWLVSSVMSLPSQIPKIRGFQRDENGVFQILRLQPSP